MERNRIMLLGLAAGLTLPLSLMAQKRQYTNFIVILMDDMGYGDLGCTGAVGYRTPRIDRMAAEGIRFTRYYAPQAVSGASRAGLMTGCYPNRISMPGAPSHTSRRGIHPDEETIAEVLKKQGYACAAYGKWHLGHLTEFLPLRNGFDEFYGIPYSNDMWPNHPTGKYPDLPLIEGEETVALNPDQTRFTADFTDRAIRFIEENRRKPFFIYLAHPMPHVPLAPSEQFRGSSEQGTYGDVMQEIDWNVGRILDKLEKEGLEKNTLVVLTSDNGPWLNYGNHAGTTGGLREGKGVSYEGGQRVPCIIQWKGHVPEGTICNEMASGIDLLPTFAAIAGAPLPEKKIDGVDITPLILGEEGAAPRKEFYYYYGRNNLEAVSDGRFKLVFPHPHRTYEGFLPGCDGKPGKVATRQLQERELFDLRRDPGERYNAIDLYPEVVERLEAMAAEARADLGDDLTRVKGSGVRPCGIVPKQPTSEE